MASRTSSTIAWNSAAETGGPSWCTGGCKAPHPTGERAGGRLDMSAGAGRALTRRARRTRDGSRGSGPPLREVPLILGAAPEARSGRCSAEPWPSGSLTLTPVAMYVDDVVVACGRAS